MTSHNGHGRSEDPIAKPRRCEVQHDSVPRTLEAVAAEGKSHPFVRLTIGHY